MSDLIDVIEAAYRPDRNDAGWLEGVLGAARPFLDRGLGLVGFHFDRDRTPAFWSPVVVGSCPVPREHVLSALGAAPASILDRVFARPSPVGTASEMTGLGRRLASNAIWDACYGALGIADTIGVSGLDTPTRGCMVAVPLARPEPVPRAWKRTWARVAAHIGAAFRLRSRAASPAGVAAPDDEYAVLTGSGSVAHAEGAARDRDIRDALAEGARRMDHARGSMRRANPDDAVELWQALVAGRWSLVDQFDCDGRRYLIARPNAPMLPPLQPLSRRERDVCAYVAMGHSNKLVAYELGIATSTVGMLLTRAARKLGVTSRADLIRRVRARSEAS